ncbi:MAG: HAD family hydrolase [Polyangiales bacterium]
MGTFQIYERDVTPLAASNLAMRPSTPITPVTTVTTVLLDVDGTLLDSNDAHARAWVAALAQHDIRVEFERMRRLIGKGGDKVLPEVSGLSAESPKGKAIAALRGSIFRQDLARLQPFPKTRELLLALRERKFRLVVASSASSTELKPLLERAGVADIIDQETSSSDVDCSKPDPDIIVAALHRAKAAPQEAVMIGDTPYDLVAARKAGVVAIAFTCGGWDRASLALATSIYTGPEDLLLHLDTSPLGASRCAP